MKDVEHKLCHLFDRSSECATIGKVTVCCCARQIAAAIFYDCNILISGFSKVFVEHCPRESNVVAHELAKFCFQ
jgi:hypothetical protein